MYTEQIMELVDDYGSSRESDGANDCDPHPETLLRKKLLHEAVEALRENRDEYQREADKLAAENKVLRDALERLARLGNEPHYGNSDGNMIAIKALTRKQS